MINLLLSSLLIGICVDIILMKILKLKGYPCTFIISMGAMFILCKAFDSYLMIVKGFLFSQMLIFAGYIDVKTKIIPNIVNIVIILIGLIGFDPLRSILGFIFVPLLFLVAAISENGAMGGGDIKLMGACGFLLGAVNGYIASFIGLALAVLITKVFHKDKDKGIALAPFLGIGSYIAYLNF